MDPFDEERRQVDTIAEANLVSSLLVSGQHAPAVDIDHDATLVVRNLQIAVANIAPPPKDRIDHAIDTLVTEGLASAVTVRGRHNPYKVNVSLSADAALVPSRTRGHNHLYVDTEIPWNSYRRILNSMRSLGVLEEGFRFCSRMRGMSMLRLPPHSYLIPNQPQLLSAS